MPSPKRLDFTPILGWSVTRQDTFSICKRRYFYQYYAKYEQEIPQPTLSRHRQLVSIPMETGAIVHEVIRALLSRLAKTTEEIDSHKLFDFAERATLGHIAAHEFDETAHAVMDRVTLQDIFPRVQVCLQNLLASERLTWIAAEATTNTSEWLIDPPGYGETRLDDLKLYCKADFLFPIRGTFHIIDWKTGQPDPKKHRMQLVGYASWASFHFDTEPDNVRPTTAYLQPVYSEVHETFNAFDLEDFAIRVRAETAEMHEFCADVENNIPLPKVGFPPIDSERVCSFCNFRGLCYPDRYQTRPPSSPTRGA